MLYSTNIKKPIISHDMINNYISDYDIYYYYIGSKFELYKIYNSPLRKDENPSFGLFESTNGKIMFNDFASKDSGDVIKFVKLKCNLKSFKDALTKIYFDLVLENNLKKNTFTDNNIHSKKHSKKITVKRRPFNKIDKLYWGQYKVITENILKELEISPVQYTFVNDILKWVHTNDNPIYVIKVYDKLKVYRPYAIDKFSKWKGSLTKNYIMGWKQLPPTGDLLIITKSFKDIAVLKGLGYNAVSPPNETSSLPKKMISEINKRFKKTVIFYDNDIPGILAANKLKDKYGFSIINLPTNSEKDISDFIKKYGIKETKKIIKTLLNDLEKKKEE
jgi:hypothetical protein